jgi:SAM-dependent methyltransferase
MAFDVPAAAYREYMGRFSEPLAVEFVDLVDVRRGQRALDVGCGPGALTTELVRHLGADRICAIDPSQTFVEAVRRELPTVQVQRGQVEALPFEDAAFDLVLAQLVVHFMTDPVAGLAEMARVAAPGGLVGANVWDYGNQRGPLSPFWRVARALDPAADDESAWAGVAEGSLTDLFARAGMPGARSEVLSAQVTLADVEDYWRPLTYGVGPGGDYLAKLSEPQREALHEQCRLALPEQPLTLEVHAWATTWRKPA